MDDVDVVAEWLLEEQPEWPQPDDPFEGMPSAERASCDRDHLPVEFLPTTPTGKSTTELPFVCSGDDECDERPSRFVYVAGGWNGDAACANERHVAAAIAAAKKVRNR